MSSGEEIMWYLAEMHVGHFPDCSLYLLFVASGILESLREHTRIHTFISEVCTLRKFHFHQNLGAYKSSCYLCKCTIFENHVLSISVVSRFIISYIYGITLLFSKIFGWGKVSTIYDKY